MSKQFRPSVRSILFIISVLLILAVGLSLARGSIGDRATTGDRAPARLGPAGADAGQTAATPGAGPAGPAVSGPVAGELAVPASFDGDVRNLPQVGPPVKRPMFEFKLPPELREGGAAVVDPVVQTNPGITVIPSPIQSFKGLDLNTWGAGWPPDTNGDVGPNHYIQTVNTSIGMYSKTGAQLAAFTFDTFFDGTGTPCDASNQGDPVVLYDNPSGRWIITDFAWSNFVSGPYYECIAVSKTGDPVAGGWWLYGFRADDATHPWLNDYPKLGVWADGIYMSANMFDILTSSGSATYKGVRVWALNREDMVSGAPLRSVRFDLGTSFASLLPSNLRGALPPSGSPDFFGSITAPSTFRLWKFHVDWPVTSNSTFTGPTNITVASFSIPSGNVPQGGSSETLDTLGDRLMMQLQYRNLGGTEALWANHTVASGGVTGVRWYEIRNPNGSPTVQQQGTYQPDTNYRWMGSLAVDSQGNMAVGYSVSSSSIFPQIRYAGRLAADPAGQLSQGETTLIAGTGSQSGGFNRWGDYSAMTVDPTDDCTFWYTTEYYETTGNNWQTRIGSFKFPACSSGPTATPTNTATAGPTATATNTSPPTNTPTITNTPPPGPVCTIYNSSNVPRSIPDLGTVTSNLTVSDVYSLSDVNVTGLSINHKWDADLDVFLIAPSTTQVELFTDVGGSGDNFSGTNLDDFAATSITAGTAPFSGTFRPEGLLSALNGQGSSGTWQLQITDDQGLVTGTLTAWGLELCRNDGATATPTSTSPPTSTATFTPTSGPTSTATSTPSPTATPTPGAGDLIYVSSTTSGTAGGVSFSDEDILTYNTTTGVWAMYFDGSDVSMSGTNVDAFDLQADGTILISIDSPTFSIPGLGTVEEGDVIRFIPTSTGDTTAGTFEWYFDGSDVDLTSSNEDIDAIGFAPDGRLLLSTTGNVKVTGVSGADEDLLAFTATQLGQTTSGTWEMYFDGSDVGLTDTTEDVNGVWVENANNDLYLTTTGAFSVTGSSGDGSDIFICHPGTLGTNTTCTFGPGLYWDGSNNGFSGQETDGVDIVR